MPQMTLCMQGECCSLHQGLFMPVDDAGVPTGVCVYPLCARVTPSPLHTHLISRARVPAPCAAPGCRTCAVETAVTSCLARLLASAHLALSPSWRWRTSCGTAFTARSTALLSSTRKRPFSTWLPSLRRCTTSSCSRNTTSTNNNSTSSSSSSSNSTSGRPMPLSRHRHHNNNNNNNNNNSCSSTISSTKTNSSNKMLTSRLLRPRRVRKRRN